MNKVCICGHEVPSEVIIAVHQAIFSGLHQHVIEVESDSVGQELSKETILSFLAGMIHLDYTDIVFLAEKGADKISSLIILDIGGNDDRKN